MVHVEFYKKYHMKFFYLLLFITISAGCSSQKNVFNLVYMHYTFSLNASASMPSFLANSSSSVSLGCLLDTEM